jgi:hypothetical protein
MTPTLELESMLTCPSCGLAKLETMPTDACQYFYERTHCIALLRARAPGVFSISLDPGTPRNQQWDCADITSPAGSAP